MIKFAGKEWVDSLGLIARGFSPHDAARHYSWAERHRILAARRLDPTLTYEKLAAFLGVTRERVRQRVLSAEREERWAGRDGRASRSPVVAYLEQLPSLDLVKPCARCHNDLVNAIRPLWLDECDDCMRREEEVQVVGYSYAHRADCECETCWPLAYATPPALARSSRAVDLGGYMRIDPSGVKPPHDGGAVFTLLGGRDDWRPDRGHAVFGDLRAGPRGEVALGRNCVFCGATVPPGDVDCGECQPPL